MALTKIPGNLIETGAITAASLDNDAVTTAKILDANITHAKLHTSMDLTGKTVTVATAAGGTNTTAAASTAFVQQELTTLIDGAPGTLDTLNELAAAINDDANYNSTLTTALATKLPLAGGTVTGVTTFTGGDGVVVQTASDTFLQLKTTGSGSNYIEFKDSGGSSGNIRYNHSTNILSVKTNGTDNRLVIDASGRVGIGTDTAANKLQIGSVGSSGYGGNDFAIGDGTRVFSTYLNSTSDAIEFYTNKKYAFLKSGSGATGYVGIGNSDPNKPLTITADSGANGIGLRARSADDYSFIQFFNNAGTALRGQIYSKAAGDIGFTTGTDSSAGNDLYIKNGTGVGIGTDSPTMPLSVQAASNAYAISMHGRSDGYSELYGASNDGSTRYSFLQSHSAQTKLYTLVNTPLLFGTNSTERMRIDTSGNVEVRNGGSLRAYRPGNSAYAGLFLDMAEDLYIRNSYSTKDIIMTREGQTKMPGPIQTTTDSGTRMFTGLATGSFYNSTGFLILKTNIPAHNTSGNANMFSLSIEGFGYSNNAYGIIDMNIGCYSGENNYHNRSYSGSNIPDPWINNIYFAKHDPSGMLAVVIGTSTMSLPAEIACTKFIQGYVNVNEDYANGWDWVTTTSLGDYSSVTKVQPKNTKNPRFAASTGTSFSISSGSWQKISDSLSENVDTAGVYDGSSGRFTPLMEGYYQFNFGGYSSYNSSTGQERYALAFAKNGSLQYIFGGNYSAADSPLVGGSQSIYLDNNDYVELWCYSSVAANWGHSSHRVWWEGYWTGS